MSRYPIDPDFEPRIADWLEADPDIAPAPVLSTVLAAFPSIPPLYRSSPLDSWRLSFVRLDGWELPPLTTRG